MIGINTAIATNNGAFQGVGFVIPSNLAKWIMGQLIKDGHVARAYLGVQPTEVDSEVAAVLHVKNGEGVLIADVTSDSPAAEAAGNRATSLPSSTVRRSTPRPNCEKWLNVPRSGAHQADGAP